MSSLNRALCCGRWRICALRQDQSQSPWPPRATNGNLYLSNKTLVTIAMRKAMTHSPSGRPRNHKNRSQHNLHRSFFAQRKTAHNTVCVRLLRFLLHVHELLRPATTAKRTTAHIPTCAPRAPYGDCKCGCALGRVFICQTK